MPKFMTIGYGDQAGYDRTAPAIRDAAHAHDDALKKRGALIGRAGAAVQVRNPDASGVQTEKAPFMTSSSELQLASLDGATLSSVMVSFELLMMVRSAAEALAPNCRASATTIIRKVDLNI